MDEKYAPDVTLAVERNCFCFYFLLSISILKIVFENYHLDTHNMKIWK
jgi:hypothetical protein